MGVVLIDLLCILCLIVTVLSVHGSITADPEIPPHSSHRHFGRHRHGGLVGSTPDSSSPIGHLPTRAWSPDISRNVHTNARPFSISPTVNWNHGFASSPSISSSPEGQSWPTPAPSPSQSDQYNMPVFSPMISPKALPPSAVMTLPPPPPNEDCTSVTCMEPNTYTVPGTPCGCVMPIQVKMQLHVALYTFFPMVSELARELAASVLFNQSQVRIMGADAASQHLERTIVLVNLIPLGTRFNFTTAYMIYTKFWSKRVFVKNSLFGGYDVLYVNYPGLPPSPPSAPSNIATIDGGSNPGHDNNGRQIKPFGANVPRKRRRKDSLSRSLIAVIVLSSFTVFVVCMAVVWVLILKCGFCAHQPRESSLSKPSGATTSIEVGSRPSSVTMSIGSSMLTYTGSAKTFSLSDIERATNHFDESRILGEGGFGLVYSGVLDDGTKVAVKVLKRNNQEGGREFLAEVEMLSRLHHRNLVKLIGICTDDHTRCLVYELISNGSVEFHLHGIDKETHPLDWGSRMKIALGAARGLAYLHEDSSPRVIHRDFKSSNILLEDDFTPKVSDFGLARTAMEEGNKHISTQVMGTFGYLAPEYAMTGHLLVKSDVYSYGVVLLELLSGRKPVDLSQPPGQENLVSWARPLLTSKEGLEAIMDPNLEDVPFDTVAKVAAIASMCVQPEVSHRPFMGEVVQALKLVSYEFDETKEQQQQQQQQQSRTCSQEDLPIDLESKIGRDSSELAEDSGAHYQIPVYDANFDSKISLSSTDLVGASGYDHHFDSKIAMSTSDLVSTAAAIEGRKDFGSSRRYASSGPLVMGKRGQFWHKLRRLSKGSTSEHGSNQ